VPDAEAGDDTTETREDAIMKRFSLALGMLLAVGASAQAQDTKWKPYRFKAGERYEFKVTNPEGDEGSKEFFYSIEIKATGKKDDAGEELLEVSYTTRTLSKKSELGDKTLFGSLGTTAIAMSWGVMTAMWSAIFSELTLKEGEKLSLFGAGLAKVTGKAKVAGRTGFVCQFSGKDGDGKEALQWEWTIDPELALPIKNVTYKDGKPDLTLELISYKAP
jgi:hypothetical protein